MLNIGMKNGFVKCLKNRAKFCTLKCLLVYPDNGQVKNFAVNGR